jgi:hypothetical protein
MTDSSVLLRPILEPEAQAFADATATPPFLPDLGPEKGRAAVDDVQSGAIAKPVTRARPTPRSSAPRPSRRQRSASAASSTTS